MKKSNPHYSRRLVPAALIILVAALSLLPTAPVRDALRRDAGRDAADGATQQAAPLSAPGETAPAREERPAPAAVAVAAVSKGARKNFDPARDVVRRDAPAAAVAPASGERREREGEPRAKPDRPDEAARWRALQLVDEHGDIPDGALMRAWEQAKRMPVDPAAWPADDRGGGESPGGPVVDPVAGIQPAGWTWLGPGNIGGRTRTIVVHPTDPQTLWVGSVSGGIWKTINGGTSWFPLDDFMANLAVSAMVIDPTNPSVLYAGTGEGFGNSDGLRGAGVFKTTDGGATWAQLSATANSSWLYVSRLAISPANSQVILAAAQTGIWRSADGGATWSQRATQGMLDINFHPTDANRAVAAGHNGARYSTDGGLTWTIPTGLPAFGRSEVAYSRSDPTVVFASVDANGGEVYRSANGGQSYALVNGNTSYLSHSPGSSSQGWYDNIIWVDPTNSNIVIVGGIDLWRSTNGGASFTRISQWGSAPQSAHADQHTIVESAQYNGTTNRAVYFGNDGGIYRANDVHTVAGTTGWQELNNNLGITQFYGGAGNPTSGRIFGGTQDNGTLRYSPGSGAAENWTTPFGGDGGWCAADPTDPNYFYGEYVYLRIHRSTNGGASSNYIYSGIADAEDPPKANFIAPFILDPNNANTMLAGGDRLWRSTNVKATTPAWAAIKNSAGVNISAIAVARGNSNVVWVGHNNGEVYFTTNGTAAAPTWTRADLGSPALPDRYCTRITIDPTNPSRVYVTFGGFNTGNVWRTDNGTSWANVSANLPAAPVRTLAVWQQNPNYLYAGTEVGVFASADGGQSWSPSNDGPTNCSVDELFWMNNTLVAATHGRGMFSISVGTAGLPPVVSLTSPAAGATFAAPASIPLAATASDPDGTVTSVEFFAGGASVGTDTTSPYAATWSNVTAGSYALTARATDNSGNTTISLPVNVTVTGGSVGPANNNFAAAQVLNGNVVSVTGSNVGATKETGEPNHHGNSGGASVWYNWQAPASGLTTVHTAGSNFDTLLAVYTGAGVGALTFIASNDDDTAASVLSSRLTFPAVAGTTYRIAVDGYNGVTGNISLSLTGAAPATSVQFSAASYSAGEGGPSAFITVTRTGSTAGGVTVAYATVDNPAAVRCDVANGTAYARCDYATTVDSLQFAAGQSQLTFAVPLINDAHVEGPEVLTLRLTAPIGATLGAQATATLTILDNDTAAAANPINDSSFFVRLQYLDFLSREPDTGGFNAWLGVLNNCPNVFNTSPSSPSAQCDRIHVSSSFFRSTEFQLKGLYAYLFYKVSFGRLPEYVEITPDMRSVSGQTQAEVYAKRAAFADAWTERAAFRAAYDALPNGAYVDALLNRYGLSQITTPDPANPEGAAQVVLTRAVLTSRLSAGTLTRSQVLRAVVQSSEVDTREYNGAFVAMQYYGYLRRTPEQPGYQNWLNLINANPNDSRTMINGFLNSVEYRLRFGAQ